MCLDACCRFLSCLLLPAMCGAASCATSAPLVLPCYPISTEWLLVLRRTCCPSDKLGNLHWPEGGRTDHLLKGPYRWALRNHCGRNHHSDADVWKQAQAHALLRNFCEQHRKFEWDHQSLDEVAGWGPVPHQRVSNDPYQAGKKYWKISCLNLNCHSPKVLPLLWADMNKVLLLYLHYVASLLLTRFPEQ